MVIFSIITERFFLLAGVHYQHLGKLQAKEKMTGLTEAESYELLAMLQIYGYSSQEVIKILAH